jgi:hypothetical protein
VARNLAALSGPQLCIKDYKFSEGKLTWRLLVVQSTSHKENVFWVVLHDDEGAAFDSAVYGVQRYGGTVVAVKTGGLRLNDGQDPNRNFDLGSGPLCHDQKARSPIYTGQVLGWWDGKAPIIGLHTNSRGFQGDGGSGTISIQKSSSRLKPFPAPGAIGESSDDTMIYVASKQAPSDDAKLKGLVDRLNAKHINVSYEIVSSTSNDCSLSNYAMLRGIRRYFNVEAVDGDRDSQREIIQILMAEIGVNPL